jgi:hypothetical protein
LLYETFVHGRDVVFLEGLEMELRYFKYFLARFFTFDGNVKKMQHAVMSAMLVV